ncbi:hypothetical protein [Thioclava sp. JM3]|uniref:hypothetical protein n=1 Tax=Thioclava sp. JM3 TaxID=1973004 RepID=UPI00117C1C92|nr:hypothetical protein [Thioclava sp. JM3]
MKHLKGIRRGQGQPMRGALWRIFLVIALIAVTLQAPAAIEELGNHTSLTVSAHNALRPIESGVSLVGCHRAHHHVHSLCAPAVILTEEAGIEPKIYDSHTLPINVLSMEGHIDSPRAPPPKSLV